MYVEDGPTKGTWGGIIDKFSAAGAYLGMLEVPNEKEPKSIQFATDPAGMTVDGEGHIWVAVGNEEHEGVSIFTSMTESKFYPTKVAGTPEGGLALSGNGRVFERFFAYGAHEVVELNSRANGDSGLAEVWPVEPDSSEPGNPIDPVSLSAGVGVNGVQVEEPSEDFYIDNVTTVGRFDPEPNSKKHHVLLAAFKEMCDAGVLRGWHLWLCGSTDGRAAHLEYIRHLEEQGRGYPVSIGVNLPFARLVDLYGRSSLYWHAMGYGEDPDRHPERFEHFGMTTVEAMAAGCVPMVIAAGGQVEIVTAGTDGFWWSSPEELKKCVARFLEMPPAEVAQMRAAARSRACDFSPDRLRARVTEIYRSLGVPTVDSAINRHRVTPQPATV